MKRLSGRRILIPALVLLLSASLFSFRYLYKRSGVQVGGTAPEIELRNTRGDLIKLSSLKGKYVIVDFWASWCIPCRRANPELVEVYKKFNSKEFENGKGLAIYSVSLDKEKDAWIAAITTDKLYWQEHVSELNAWQSKTAEAYGVESIPSNFLLDGEGKVIAKNLMGNELEKFLKKKVKD